VRKPCHQKPDASVANRAFFTCSSGSGTNKTWTKKRAVDNTARPMSPASCVRKSFVLMGLLCAFPALVFGQTNGLETNERALNARNSDQVYPAVAIGSTGGFVVWQDNISDPFGLGVSAQRLNGNLTPDGPVLPVNQTTPLDQHRAKVAMLAQGGALVVWQGGRPGAQNIFARILGPDSTFTTGEFLVNNPAVKVNSRVTTNWTLIYNNRERTRRQVIKESVHSRHDFNANPSVAVLTDGSAVVAWSSSRVLNKKTVGLREWTTYKENRDGSFTIINNRRAAPISIKEAFMQDVYVQRLSATGEKLGAEFRANQFTEFNQRDVSVSALDNGNFVLVWVSEQQRSRVFDIPGNFSPAAVGASSVDVYARLFDGNGNALGDEFLVNSGALPCGAPSVTGAPGGGFTIVWAQGSGVRTNGLDVFGRTFDASAAASSSPFRINAFTYGDQFSPTITSLGGQQLVVWSSMGQDGSWEGAFARALNGAAVIGDEFRVNLSTPYSQKHSQVASDGAGRALIVWSSYRTDGSAFDVFGRTYVAP
jgi:hypothetical protein